MHQRPPADLAYSDEMAATAGPAAGQTESMAPEDDYHGDADGTTVNTFDDVFGGENDNDHATAHNEPSDMNRLRHDHATAGYREGLAAAKAASVQVGFDEGYGLGAALGREVGELLGLVEGVAAARVSVGAATTTTTTTTTTGDATPATTDVASLLTRARQELTVVAVFGKDYFAPDGTWLYDVETADDATSTTILDVARAHPLVRTWRGLVGGQLRRYGVRWGDAGAEAALAASLGLGEGEDEDETADGRTATATATTTTATTTTSARPPTTALDW